MAKELLTNPAGEEIPLGEHPETGLKVVAKNGRYGPFVTELLPEDAPEEGQAAHRLAVQGHVVRDDRPRTGRAAAVPAACGRSRRRRRGDHGAERPLRSLPQARHRLALAGDREPALRHHAGTGAGDLRPAQAAWSRRGCRPAEGARQRPGLRGAGGGQGRTVRGVRHRRSQRDPPQDYRRGDHHRWAPSASPSAAQGAYKKAAKRGARRTAEGHQEPRRSDQEAAAKKS